MSAIPYESRDENWPTHEQEDLARPGRRRRPKLWSKPTAVLAAIILAAAGFYGGVRVEKSQLGNSASAAAALPAGARTGAAPTAGTGAAAGAGPRAGFGGGGGGGGPFAGGNGSFGKVASVDGNTLYLTDNSGNTTKVTLSSSTKISKSVGVSKSSVHPGDTVVIQGLKNSSGTLVATSLSDTGAGTTGGASSASGSSGTSSTAGSGTSSGTGN
jgi:hypothetical protein